MVLRPVHSSQPPTSAVKFLNDGDAKIGEKLTSRLWIGDVSVHMGALSVLVMLHGEGISFWGSGQKIGVQDRIAIHSQVG